MVMFYKLVLASTTGTGRDLLTYNTRQRHKHRPLTDWYSLLHFRKTLGHSFFLNKLPDEKNEQNHNKFQTLLFNFPVQGACYTIDEFCQI